MEVTEIWRIRNTSGRNEKRRETEARVWIREGEERTAMYDPPHILHS